MSLKKSLRTAGKTISFRIAAGYSLLFLVSCLILFAMAYLFVYATLTRQSRDSVLVEANNLSERYQSGGLAAFEEAVRDTYNVQKWSPFLIRTLTGGGKTRKFYYPRQWRTIDPARIPTENTADPGDLLTWKLPGGATLTLVTVTLSDGFRFQVGHHSKYRDLVLVHFEQLFLLGALPVILLACAGGLLLAHRSLTPVRQLIQTVTDIDAGQYNARAPRSHSNDELDELGRLFNKMLHRISTLINSMKSALDTVAHDLRTPMTRFRNKAETALVGPESLTAYRDALTACIEESDRILGMLNMLMDISEAESGTLTLNVRDCDLSRLLTSVADMYAFVAEEKGLRFTATIAPEVRVRVDPERISQMVANLLDNAVKFTSGKGAVHLAMSTQPDGFCIQVTDTGVGIAPSEIDMIWNRLYRNPAKGHRGIGLGLSLVRAIVEAHNGQIQVSPNPGGGSVFDVRLPVHATPPPENPSKM
jgi:signal transduction histidine kinase